ncbi:hypothetical protein GC207_04725 [bacterium]|nr:hypothetical protein [bacterium]
MERSEKSKDWWRQPLVLALCASLLLHALFYGTWRIGRAFGWWKTSLPFLSRILTKLNAALVDPKKIQAAIERQQQLADREVPLTFVDVLPEQATVDKPAKPDFYSSLNSEAASKQASDEDSNKPTVDGEQEKVVKAVDIPRNSPAPVVQTKPQPTPPVESPPEPEKVEPDKLQPSAEPDTKLAGTPDVPEAKVDETTATKPGVSEPLRTPAPRTDKPGDVTREQVSTQPEKGDGAVKRGDNGEAKQPRPRTIAEAQRQLNQNNSIAGQKMKLEGATRRQRILPSFNTEQTPWGSYDAKFIAIVTSRWYRFLDQHPEAFNFGGRVVVKFDLYYDGSIKNFTVLERPSNLDPKIEDEMQVYGCNKAIVPELGRTYDPWPPYLRRITQKDYRELRFTFYYN